MSIGEFARRSRLSANALRLYDELGLLPPARVDASSAYRSYAAAQLEQAHLVAMLRQRRPAVPDADSLGYSRSRAGGRKSSEDPDNFPRSGSI